MSVSDAQRRQQIVQEFHRRRARELVALIPGGLAAYAAHQSYEDPAFTVGGLSGRPLLVLAVAVVVAYFAHHLINWRCPVCRRHFLTGFLIQSCPRCGALFVGDGTPPTRSDLEMRRKRYLLQELAAVLLFGLGLFVIMVLANSPGAVRPDGWLSRLLGDDARVLLQVIGFGIAVLSFLWMFFTLRAITGVDLQLQGMRGIMKE